LKPRVPRTGAMRVATALTGLTTCAAGFLPVAVLRHRIFATGG
jgi:hypothetical protein